MFTFWNFGILYNFSIRNVSKVYSPSVFEIYLTFDFSKYKRNSRGLYKRFQTDNYFSDEIPQEIKDKNRIYQTWDQL